MPVCRLYVFFGKTKQNCPLRSSSHSFNRLFLIELFVVSNELVLGILLITKQNNVTERCMLFEYSYRKAANDAPKGIGTGAQPLAQGSACDECRHGGWTHRCPFLSPGLDPECL